MSAPEQWAHLSDRSIRHDGWLVIQKGRNWVAWKPAGGIWRTAGKVRARQRWWRSQRAAVEAVDLAFPLAVTP